MDLNVVWTFKNLKMHNEKHHEEKVALFKQKRLPAIFFV